MIESYENFPTGKRKRKEKENVRLKSSLSRLLIRILMSIRILKQLQKLFVADLNGVTAYFGGCENGGHLKLPSNIFGHCHCVCRRDFTGPTCQFLVVKKNRQPDVSLSCLSQRAQGSKVKVEFMTLFFTFLASGQGRC